MNLGSAAKTAVAEYFNANGEMPTTANSAGYSPPSTEIVSTIAVGRTSASVGTVTVTLSSSTKLGSAAGGTITLTGTGSGTAVEWTCTSNQPKYVPANCR